MYLFQQGCKKLFLHFSPIGHLVPVITEKAAQIELMQRAHFGEGVTIQANSVGGHQGQNKTRRELTAKCYWRGMTTDIQEFIEACDRCQRVKGVRYDKEWNMGYR